MDSGWALPENATKCEMALMGEKNSWRYGSMEFNGDFIDRDVIVCKNARFSLLSLNEIFKSLITGVGEINWSLLQPTNGRVQFISQPKSPFSETNPSFPSSSTFLQIPLAGVTWIGAKNPCTPYLVRREIIESAGLVTPEFVCLSIFLILYLLMACHRSCSPLSPDQLCFPELHRPFLAIEFILFITSFLQNFSFLYFCFRSWVRLRPEDWSYADTESGVTSVSVPTGFTGWTRLSMRREGISRSTWICPETCRKGEVVMTGSGTTRRSQRLVICKQNWLDERSATGTSNSITFSFRRRWDASRLP